VGIVTDNAELKKEAGPKNFRARSNGKWRRKVEEVKKVLVKLAALPAERALLKVYRHLRKGHSHAEAKTMRFTPAGTQTPAMAS
jgi:N-methylhydantoinase A/oxoprolinase/acetone carboxylase beta subunit